MNTKIAILTTIIILLGILAFAEIFSDQNNKEPTTQIQASLELSSLTDSDTAQLKFQDTDLTLEIAKSEQKQQIGLMNRNFLDRNNGMIFIFSTESPQTFWMKDTLISLDIIFLNKNLQILTIYQSTEPNQTSTIYPSVIPTQYAIEMNGGWSISHNLKIGDTFNL